MGGVAPESRDFYPYANTAGSLWETTTAEERAEHTVFQGGAVTAEFSATSEFPATSEAIRPVCQRFKISFSTRVAVRPISRCGPTAVIKTNRNERRPWPSDDKLSSRGVYSVKYALQTDRDRARAAGKRSLRPRPRQYGTSGDKGQRGWTAASARTV